MYYILVISVSQVCVCPWDLGKPKIKNAPILILLKLTL